MSQVVLAALVPLAIGLLQAGCLATDERPSPTPSNHETQSDPLASVALEKIELPDPASQGSLCVTLSSSDERTLDEVAIVAAGEAAETLHTFSELHVTDAGMKSCTSTCLCFGPEPPPLDVVLHDDGDKRRITSGKTAPTGCCGSE